MYQLAYITVILFLASIGSSVKGDRSYKSVHTVSNGGPWGTWGDREMCPAGYYAAGFSLKVEYPVDGDDTALNGIRLHCVNTPTGKSLFSDVVTVTSKVGSWGTWTNTKWCPSGMLTSFQLRVEGQCNDNDFAFMTVRFECSGDVRNLVGEGTSWGEWGGWSKYCRGKGFCGIQTKVEGSQGSGDDTTLNDVKFFCCD
ncbi:vitelline membrane outer layer protein 1-like [Colossoma macropomum]|uniref:vitelline membrane outer layer protein 1-like n=1 Tax=Colossoma macropomum TaxID=42526 RepID=UPI001864EBB8|nr:vitelline membrane outer layer protein 1-like [Colossoma macropomum]